MAKGKWLKAKGEGLVGQGFSLATLKGCPTN